MYANLSNHVADESGLIEINSKRFEACARKWRNVEPDKLGRTQVTRWILPKSSNEHCRRFLRSIQWCLEKRVLRHAQTGRQLLEGYLRLSLVSIGVEIYNAVESKSEISFRQIHKPSGRPIN